MLCVINCGVLARMMPLGGITAGAGAGRPLAIEPYTPGALCACPKVLSALYWLLCFTGKLSQAYLLSGKGIQLSPKPARRTVLESILYASPVRGAKSR